MEPIRANHLAIIIVPHQGANDSSLAMNIPLPQATASQSTPKE